VTRKEEPARESRVVSGIAGVVGGVAGAGMGALGITSGGMSAAGGGINTAGGGMSAAGGGMGSGVNYLVAGAITPDFSSLPPYIQKIITQYNPSFNPTQPQTSYPSYSQPQAHP
jgi:hypothetical protein